MTTLIISSIIALLVIAGLLWAATRIGKWIHVQSRSVRFAKPIEAVNRQDDKCLVFMNGELIGELNENNLPLAIRLDLRRKQKAAQNKLVEEAKDILNKHQ